MKIQKGAIQSPDKAYRYALWRIWDATKPMAFFIILNPNEKDENEDDATILKCIALAEKEGFGGVIIGSLFALRTEDPNIFLNHKDPIGPDNNAVLKKFAGQAFRTIAVWGSRGTYMDRHDTIMRTLPNLHCYGMTKNGQPIHALSVPDDAELKAIRVE